MLITVFTPTYNRASLLPRLYDSLCKQTYKHFEWLIIDDGSTDDTSAVVSTIKTRIAKSTPPFELHYIKKENGGKHSAINLGVKIAQGEIFFIADSDDALPADALQAVNDVWKDIEDDNSFGGICGLDGKIGQAGVVGTGFPTAMFSDFIILNGREVGYIDGTNMQVRFGMGIQGDMKEVFRTSVLQEFPFPEVKGELFCPEVLVWNRIGTKYQLRYINKIIYLAEYQAGGITSGITRARMKSPIATMMTYQEMTEYDIPLKWRLKSAINYWRFRFCCRSNMNTTEQLPQVKWYWNICLPIGWMMHLKDLVTCK